MDLHIHQQWNGEPIQHDPIHMKLEASEDGLNVQIEAPFFDDPPPAGAPGEPMWLLWEFEVVELFFLNSNTGEYLELEFGPHGQHLALIFKECRKPWKKCLKLDFTSKITGQKWSGFATIPWDYFPAAANKFNAYGIHGTGENRIYEALFPVPKDRFKEPDYHRLEFFGDFADLVPKSDRSKDSIWLD